MREPITLVFGDKAFKVRPLSFKQVRDFEALFAEKLASGSEMAFRAVGIALSRDHADVVVDDLDCDVTDLPAQLAAIMTLGGFEVGEAPAAAESAPITSTGPA